jgi:hypothetical protein
MKLHGLSPARDWLTLLTVDINITKFYAVTAMWLQLRNYVTRQLFYCQFEKTCVAGLA